MLAYSDQDYDPCEDERDELRAMSNAKRAYDRRLSQNPDCRDPDHPGCSHCMEDEE